MSIVNSAGVITMFDVDEPQSGRMHPSWILKEFRDKHFPGQFPDPCLKRHVPITPGPTMCPQPPNDDPSSLQRQPPKVPMGNLVPQELDKHTLLTDVSPNLVTMTLAAQNLSEEPFNVKDMNPSPAERAGMGSVRQKEPDLKMSSMETVYKNVPKKKLPIPPPTGPPTPLFPAQSLLSPKDQGGLSSPERSPKPPTTGGFSSPVKSSDPNPRKLELDYKRRRRAFCLE